ERQSAIVSQETTLLAEYRQWKSARDAAERATRDAAYAHGAIEREHHSQADLVMQLRWLPDVPLDVAETRYLAADEVYREARAIHSRLQRDRDEKRQMIARLRSNQAPLPPDVEAFLGALRAEHIPFVLIADVVQVRDERWQHAVE